MKAMFNESNGTTCNDDTSTSSSLTIWEALSLGILTLETFIGTFMNGLMVIANLITLLTHKKLSSCDSILACLGLSRLTFMWLVLAMYYVSFVAPNSTDIGTNLQYGWLFFNDLSLWCATWLSTFYCVRIVNIQKYMFTALKTHFDHLLPFLILASIVISASCSNSTAYRTINQTFNMSKLENHRNSTPLAAIGTNYASFMTLSVVGSVPPFFLFCIFTGLVVYSLIRHMVKMKAQDRTGFREPSLDAHYRAVKMMGAFFIFFSLYIVAFNLYASGILQDGLVSCIAAFLIGAYPSVHSVLLVIGNHKLKQAFVSILQKTNCYQKQVIQTISD